MLSNGKIPPPAELEQLTVLFRLLSDPTRLNILLLLASGEQNVTELCKILKLPQPTVSHHLGLLRISNVITNRRSGKQMIYSLNGRLAQDARELIVEHDRFVLRVGAKQ
jgi:ArsR family transcriptional regulator, zinc-responsive transcriptional repressor